LRVEAKGSAHSLGHFFWQFPKGVWFTRLAPAQRPGQAKPGKCIRQHRVNQLAAAWWCFQEYLAIDVMIETEAQLQQAFDQIENLCRAVQSLRADVFPRNPRNFAVLAEGPVDEIRKLQVDVDNYLSRLEGISAGIA
jgi:hypothetical protein